MAASMTLWGNYLQGWATTSLPEQGIKPEGASVAPLLDAIVKHVPPPAGDMAAPFAMLVAMVEHDAFLGPIATGRVAAGTARVGDRVRVLHHTGEKILETLSHGDPLS